jgi:hypothetical protein
MTTLLVRRDDTRDDLPTDAEIARQAEMVRVLVHGARPTTLVGWKTAAIGGADHADYILQAKVGLQLAEWLTDDRIDPVGKFLLDADMRDRLRAQLEQRPIKLREGDIIRVPLKMQRPVLYPRVAAVYNGPPLDLVPIDPVSLAEFESICFENRIAARYLNADDFPRYLFTNLMYSLGASQLTDLADKQHLWQARLAALLAKTKCDPRLANNVFYSNDVVSSEGVSYTADFVPKYNVSQLRPYSTEMKTVTDERVLRYRKNLDVRKVRVVPEKYRAIFRTFPFKDGHLIIGTTCDPSRLEDSANNLANTLDPSDVLDFAVTAAQTETENVLALMTLRRMHGPVVRIGALQVTLPTDQMLMSWVNRYMPCSKLNPRELLPPSFGPEVEPIAKNFYELIRDIASCCGNKLGASIVCGAYAIPAVAISQTIDQIENQRGITLVQIHWQGVDFSSGIGGSDDNVSSEEAARRLGYAEMYVALSFILQENNLLTLHATRDRLGEPRFGRKDPASIDWSRHRSFLAQVRPMPESWMPDPQDRIEPIVLPTSIASGDDVSGLVPIDVSPVNYRFRNPQLAQLARDGELETELTDYDQLASMIAIALDNPPLEDDY